MPHYFDKAAFCRDLAEYRAAPDDDKLTALITTYLNPLCCGYARSGHVRIRDADVDDVVAIALERCVAKLHCYEIGRGSPLAYFSRIAYFAIIGYASKEYRRCQQECHLDNEDDVCRLTAQPTPPSRPAIDADAIVGTSSTHDAAILAIIYDMPIDQTLGISTEDADRLKRDLGARISAPAG